jgi:hypothetical protein
LVADAEKVKRKNYASDVISEKGKNEHENFVFPYYFAATKKNGFFLFS